MTPIANGDNPLLMKLFKSLIEGLLETCKTPFIHLAFRAEYSSCSTVPTMGRIKLTKASWGDWTWAFFNSKSALWLGKWIGRRYAQSKKTSLGLGWRFETQKRLWWCKRYGIRWPKEFLEYRIPINKSLINLPTLSPRTWREVSNWFHQEACVGFQYASKQGICPNQPLLIKKLRMI